MCWSADADLVAGSVIMAVGVGCVAGVRRSRDVPLASTPAAVRVRRRLQALVVVGAATSAVLAITLARHPVTARPLGHTIGYTIDVPMIPLVIAGYLAATLGALLLAPDPRIRALGVISAIGAAACFLVWELAFASTWCAVAAVASLVLLRWAW